jgi:hypothetical protein
MYRLVARDPLLLKAPAYRMDDARVRYQRILVPLAAWLLALGQGRWVDGAYVATVAAFLLLGVYWLARWFQQQGLHPRWGVLFLLLPPCLISADRMTVEAAVTALALAAALAAERRPGLLWVALALAALNRETGLLLILAAVAAAGVCRRWRQAVLLGTAGLPLLAWMVYLHFRLPAPDPSVVPAWVGRKVIGLGILGRILHPIPYPGLTSFRELVTQQLDRLALLGVVLALGLALWTLRSWRWSFVDFALLAHFPLFLLVNSPGFFSPVHGYARPFGPLFALLLVRYRPGRPEFLLSVLASLLIAIRLAAGSFWQVQGVVGGILAL